MRKVLLLLMVLLTQALSAQVYYGESKLFGLKSEQCDPYTDLGCIRHYITAKAENTYFVISVPGKNEAIDISKNNNVRVEFNNDTYIKTQVHSAEVVKVSRPYARERLYSTIIEFPIDEEELCKKKRIRKIYIERDCGNIYVIEIGKFWALCLNRLFPEYIDKAKENAQKDKEQKELLADKYQMPEYIRQYIEENYPDHSYSLVELDTVHLPLRSVMLLDYYITEEYNELTVKIDEAEEAGENYTQMVQQGEELVKNFKKELAKYEHEYMKPTAARGDENDYQRVVIELVNYNGTENVTIFTRVGEVLPTDFDFHKEADGCRASIEELEKYIGQLREKGSEKTVMMAE